MNLNDNPDCEHPPSKYAWLITKDHLFNKFGPPDHDEKPDIGQCGPHNAPDHLLAQLHEGRGTVFKLYDDDGELYYTGLIITEPTYPIGDFSLAPLDDFGTGWAGCTSVRYPDHPVWNN